MLGEDREEMNEATRAAAIADFTHVAQEYFETDGVTLSSKRGKKGTEVSVTFRASGVKNFMSIR